MPHSRYARAQMGSATIEPAGEFEAGSFASFTLTYTAGYFGIDDTGSIKIVQRFASDMGRPQFTEPTGWNYTTVEASNGAVLQVEYDAKRNIRPWDKTLFIRVVRGFLREGDRIEVRYGDRRGGSPGIRVQTFVEPTFEFKVLADPFAAYEYAEIESSPTISVVAGPPVAFRAVLPTLRSAGQPFALGFKGEDKWGNPSHRVSGEFALRASVAVKNLPAAITVKQGTRATRIAGLAVAEPGELEIEVVQRGQVVAVSNPCRIATNPARVHFWADLHGQSEETIGTNSARELIEFGRDCAFLDAMSHQGNDFQITADFWQELNRLATEYDRAGEFVMFPGYEWSGNTGLGGDRNVLYLRDGEPIHRSSHALVEDLSDVGDDANDADALFRALAGRDAVVFAHIGGRYADIARSHDARLERSIEIHSDWGTFEWLLEDAFEQGYRVGILANSDGHKGRHGASHPGASLFGAYGGLSCLVAAELTRDCLAECLRARRHYATTGCRAFLDMKVTFDAPATVFSDDPLLGGAVTSMERAEAQMGEVVEYGGDCAYVEFEIATPAAIESVEVRNRMEVVERVVPYAREALGRRIRMVWEGSEYRGRGRQTVWDGGARLVGNAFRDPKPINFWNLDKELRQVSESELQWKSLTTGGFSGVDVMLRERDAGELTIATGPVTATLPVRDIGFEARVLEGGGIRKQMRIYRLPDANDCRRLRARVRVPLQGHRDNALYLRATTEDGFWIYSSPVYVARDARRSR
ncbi:MAG: hypothetical protein ABIR98_03940 [Usitatibacter sp.]